MTEDEQKATLDDGLKVPPRRGSDFSFRLPTPTALLALASASTPSRENRACWGPRDGLGSFAPTALVSRGLRHFLFSD